MTEAEKMVEEAALIIAVLDGCGLTIDGERTLCDDPRADVSIRAAHCFCRASARAACEIVVRRCAEMIADEKRNIDALYEVHLADANEGRSLDRKAAQSRALESIGARMLALAASLKEGK